MDTKEPLRTFSGKIIGWLITNPNGDQTLTDFSGRILGYYKKADNTTRDFYNVIKARGNLLLLLLNERL